MQAISASSQMTYVDYFSLPLHIQVCKLQLLSIHCGNFDIVLLTFHILHAVSEAADTTLMDILFGVCGWINLTNLSIFTPNS